MCYFALALSVLLSTVAFVRGTAPSAGACGPTSVPNVPGCWGLDGCAYVIASDLGSGAACSYDYCNCNETPVPLLPETISGTTTIGCASWTTQPSVSKCPTAAPVIPAPGGGGAPTQTPTLASGATVIVGTIAGGATETETFEPTTYTQFASVTATITTTIVNAKSSIVTVVVGPSGVAWTPYDPPSGVPNLPPPSVLPGAPSDSKPSNVPLPPGGTVITATIGSSAITETFVLTTVPAYASLVSTLTTSSLNAESSPVTFLIGPGGVQWTPLNFPSGSPGIPPPTVLPVDPNAPSLTPSSLTTPTLTPGASPASYASVTDAFANTAQSQTTVVAGGITIPYAISTFPDLTSITAVTTVTTAVTETNKDGTHFTIPAAIIIVGPGGRWWNGGTGGFGINLPSCIWPFCPPGGGGDIGGAGSGESPNDPDTPGSPEKPSDPDDPNNDDDTTTTKNRQSPSSTQVSSTPSSSCESKTIASDCSVICSTPTGLSTLSCATDCYSTVTGCSATGTTISTTESGGACALPTGWGSNLASGEDAPIYQPLGPAAPRGVASNTASVTTSTNTAPSGPHTATGTGASSPPVGGGSSKATPTCLADGAPWYSPTSWCDCGPSSTYATLSPTAGATSANCAYTSLPASTIQPVSTGTAPTNTPGQGGLPGCAAVVSVPGTSAYCNCGGTPAPTLKPTSSGLMNCDYTIQPTSSYNPAIPPPAKSAPPPSPTTGTSPAKSAPPPSPTTSTTCRLHLWQGLGQEISQPEVVLDINITYTSSTTVISHNASSLNWGQPLKCGGSLPDVLSATPQTGVSNSRRSASRTVNKRLGAPQEPRPLYENGPIDFVYGTQTWDTSAAQCTVGGWDNGNAADFFGALIFGDTFVPNRQLECTFDCPGSGKAQKREVAVPFGRPLGVEEDSRRNIFARDPSATTDDGPTAIDEHLFDVRALTDHGAEWQKYAPKGAAYYAAWQAKTGADAVYQCDSNFEQEFNVAANPPTICSPVNSVKPLLSSLGIGTGKDYYYIAINGPQSGPIADFTDTISPTEGVFLAGANTRGALPSDPTDPMYNPDFPNGRQPVPWQFSSVAWWMWRKSCLTANPSWVTNPALADYSGIKYFFRREITNEDTQSILNECFTGKDITQTLTWTPEDTNQDTNPFWALLGSPNGNGIIYFLTDNKVALKGKRIVSISATTINGYYTMWATFG